MLTFTTINNFVNLNVPIRVILLILLITNVLLVMRYQLYITSEHEILMSKIIKFDNISCHNKEEEDDLPSVDGNVSFPEKSIFFVESSCKGRVDARQACSIEAAARTNPGWQINVLFSGPVPKYSRKPGPIEKLQQFSNVNISRVHLFKYGNGTPLQSMLINNMLNESEYLVQHTSDVLRFLTLYKFGGVYLDLDVIVVKPFDSLPKNFAAREDSVTVAAGAMAFSRNEIGRRFAEAAIEDMKKNFNPYSWNGNGVGVIMRVLRQLCSTSNVTRMSAANCNGFEVFEPKYFYPIYYKRWQQYFDPSLELYFEDSYAFHMWNSLSYGAKVLKGSFFAKLAEKFCPTIYNMYRSEFGF